VTVNATALTLEISTSFFVTGLVFILSLSKTGATSKRIARHRMYDRQDDTLPAEIIPQKIFFVRGIFTPVAVSVSVQDVMH
jgi:hypothetical protein